MNSHLRPIALTATLVALGCNQGATSAVGADELLDAEATDGSVPVHDAVQSDTSVATDAPVDEPAQATDAADADEPSGPAELPPYVRAYPETATWSAPEGTRWARAIVHLHSAHSHDACDGNPRPDGLYNERCIADLRAAMCRTRLDVAWLTDHPTHVAETPFLDSLLFQPELGDVLVRDELERPMANSLNCGDGFRVIVRSGSEDRLMPLGFRGHPLADTRELDLLLNERTPDAVATMRSTGALIWQAHTEERSLSELREVELDGIEVYQLHANLDPDIRRDALGLDPTAPLVDLVPFVTGETDTPPDLAALAFLEPNAPSLNRWAALLADRPVVGTAGTDAHQNVLRAAASDGERFDSYRRMIAWFSNYLLVEGALTAETAERALAEGRVVIGFDVLGNPAGFDVALRVAGLRHEVGATAGFEAGARIAMDVPAPEGPDGSRGAVRISVLRAEGEGWTEVWRAEGAGSHEAPITDPGVYRVEVRTTGRHLAGYMADFPQLHDREYTWLMTNAWRVL